MAVALDQDQARVGHQDPYLLEANHALQRYPDSGHFR